MPLRDDGDLGVRGKPDYLLHQRFLQGFEPGRGGGAAQKDLGHAVRAGETRDGPRDVLISDGMSIDAQIAGEMDVAFDGVPSCGRQFGPATLGQDVQDQAVAAQVIGDTVAATDQRLQIPDLNPLVAGHDSAELRSPASRTLADSEE